MESNIEEQILMRKKISFSRLNCKELVAEKCIPLKFRTNVTKVGELNSLGNFRVNYDSSKSDSIFHKFHFDSMSCSKNVE